jgi:hypothetical protein
MQRLLIVSSPSRQSSQARKVPIHGRLLQSTRQERELYQLTGSKRGMAMGGCLGKLPRALLGDSNDKQTDWNSLRVEGSQCEGVAAAVD